MAGLREIGRAACRERGEISVVAGSLKKKKKIHAEAGAGRDVVPGLDADARRTGGRRQWSRAMEAVIRGLHVLGLAGCFFFSSRRRHTRCYRDWSSDVCSSDLGWGGGTRRRRSCGGCPGF